MNKLNQLLKLVELVDGDSQPQPKTEIQDLGQNIIVLDRGFVYVGEVSKDGDFIIISNAKNIRKWGTSKGLGELVNGKLPDTILDPVGEVKAPFKSLIHLIKCNGF